MTSFADPIHRLFNHPGLRRGLLRMRIPLTIAIIVFWPWWVKSNLILAGILMTMVGELLQVWCFACLEKEKVLTIRGPYQLCRNPMYLARYLLILGFIICTGSWVAMALYTLIYWFYMVNRVKREEPVLEDIFGPPYLEYCTDVNRFLPGLKRLDKDFWFFNLNIMLHNNGHWNFLLAVLGYVYLFVMLRWVV